MSLVKFIRASVKHMLLSKCHELVLPIISSIILMIESSLMGSKCLGWLVLHFVDMTKLGNLPHGQVDVSL